MKKLSRLVFLGIFGTALSCDPTPIEEPSKPLFRLLESSETGVDFSNQLKSSPEFNILEYLYFYNGGGVAVGDINNDGLEDIFFTANQSSNKLYLNQGELKFNDISADAGIEGKGTWSTGVTMADVNADGYLDIYVSQVGDYKQAKGKNELYINQKDGTFIEQAAAYGLDFVGFSTQAAFFDYDKDGDLDMYLLNHSIKNPEIFSPSSARFKNDPQGDRLFQSQMAQGKTEFIDVTEQSGIYSSLLGFGLGLGIGDVNNDNWPDIYVSNDFTENDYLFLNNQDGTFSEELESRIRHTSRYSMGNVLADINNDNQLDIITTDMLPSDPKIWKKSLGEDKREVYDLKLRYGYAHQYVRNTMQINLGDGQYFDASLFAENYATDWSWSPLVFDMNNDGLPDIHISNGIYKRPNDLDFINYVTTNTEETNKSDNIEELQLNNLPTLKIPNYAGLNKGALQFESSAKTLGLDQASYSNGSAYADLDNDGDLEIIINNIEQDAFIYENLSDSTQNHLQVTFTGPEENPFGTGARIAVKGENFQLTQENYNTKGFQSAVSQRLHFGLGNISNVELEVTWPDGKKEKKVIKEVNRVVNINYENASIDASSTKDNTQKLSASPLQVNYKHIENEFDDVDREYLIPRRYSKEGPALAVGDVNGDGKDDIYLGGAKEQPGYLFIQKNDGSFEQRINPMFEQLARAEDVDALFFDADGDKDLDLYVVSGGNEFEASQIFSYDRIFINDGRGNFQFSPGALRQVGGQGKIVIAEDIDGDGDQDLFVGVNVVAGSYGTNPKHYLLINNGRGMFEDQTARISNQNEMGSINDAKWADIDGDGDSDLITAGEWSPIKVFINDGKGNFSQNQSQSLTELKGWWSSVEVKDLNGDGKLDIIAGNLGLNSKLKASKEEPLSLYLNDFDNNGQSDPIVFHFQEGVENPFASRDDLIKQVVAFKKLHGSYVEYSEINQPKDLLGDKVSSSTVKSINTLESMVWLNKGNNEFESIALPNEAQFTNIDDIVFEDLDKDGITDLIVFGNDYNFRNDYGKMDSAPIVLLKGNGKGSYQAFSDLKVDLNSAWGDYNSAELIKVSGKAYIIGVRNNDNPVLISVDSK